jgi:phosphate transport system permease protein
VWSDWIAKQIITVGGIGTIFVVLLVVLVLLANVVPLFQATRWRPLQSFAFVPIASEGNGGAEANDTNGGAVPVPVPTPAVRAGSRAIGLDEYSELLWSLGEDQSLTIYAIANAKEIKRFQPKVVQPSGVDGAKPASISAVRVESNQLSLLLGLSDGSIRPVTLVVDVTFEKWNDLEAALKKSVEQGPVVVDGTLYRVTSGGLVRKVTVSDVAYQDPIRVLDGPVESLDWRVKTESTGFDDSQTWTWAASSGTRIALGTIVQKGAGLGGKTKRTTEIWSADLAEGLPAGATSPSPIRGLMISALGDSVESIDDKGQIVWWKQEDGQRLKKFQVYQSLTGMESEPTASAPLLGRSTWVIGSRSGHVEGVAITSTQLGQELLTIHRMATGTSPVVSLAASPNHRIVGSLNEAGDVQLIHVSSEQTLASFRAADVQAASVVPSGSPKPATMQNSETGAMASGGSPSRTIQFSPNGQTLAIHTPDHVELIAIDSPFPESSWATFFNPVWYEGYSRPQHIWQSSTGSIEGETKFGMWPLIYGTFKATLYSMMIAAPIALLAAIFGSEFMSRKWRSRFKPLIELMASIPSVVLGFIGAIVVAPFLRDSLAWVLLSVLLTIVFFLFAAHLWMLIPIHQAIPLRRFRLPLMFLVPPVAIVCAGWIADGVEQYLFATTITDWLSDGTLSRWPGWFLLGILPLGLLTMWLVSGPCSGWLHAPAKSWSHSGSAAWSLLVFGLSCLAVLVLSGLVASGLSSMGWDARGTLVGPYQERNAVLVGGILGFAIIPLIYTLADDALQSVPQHLRSASLGCGATVWQTTVRVVVPTAMSGLFSALMIGFGRAIGETMVVLMAAGNTPLMEINPFNGYRTLSATLATELPEAARGSTHYHTLFLAALLLFIFTLVANTCAEWVRLRFRKRAFQL